MPIERYFSATSFQANQLCELKEAEFHHLAHVMRTRKGDTVELVNGQGFLAQACVQSIEKNRALLQIESVLQEEPPRYQLILAQALSKPNRLDFILEKGTELGVTAFWLFPGELSAKKEFYPHQMERAQALTIAAMKQCGRLTLPEIHLLPALGQWSEWPPLAFFGDVHPTAPLFEAVWKQSSSRDLSMFITGPESGFSAQEVEILKNHGVKGVKLHPFILRTETASLMALSLLSHWITSSSFSGGISSHPEGISFERS